MMAGPRRLTEAEFFEKLGLLPSDGTHAQCTMRDLTRMLNVSSARLRRWLRDRLIEPTAVEHRLAYFDFHQVTNARRLSELVSRGASLVSIRSGLEQLQRWLPEEQLPLAQLARLEHDGRLLLRLHDRLLDRQGQRHFDFDAGQRARGAVALSVARKRHCGLDDLFDAALAAEDSGRLDEAEQLYAQAIDVDASDPVLHFNRGNVLFALARFDDACASFRASLAYDGDYAEAWNNLGNALMEFDDLPAAEEALRRALALLPDDDAVHGSLADVLERRGQPKEAQRHRRLAQQHRQRSPAEHGRQLLRIARPAE
jgi:tetratricopeptide (TPR) repeat protein